MIRPVVAKMSVIASLLLCFYAAPVEAEDPEAIKTIEIRQLSEYINSPTPVAVEGISGEFRKYSATTNCYLLSRMFVSDAKDKIWVKTNKNYPDKDRQYRVTGTVVREGERLFLLEQKRELIVAPSNTENAAKENDEEKKTNSFELSQRMMLGIGLIGISLIVGIVIIISMRKGAVAKKMMLEQQRQAVEQEKERIQKLASPASVPTNATTVAAGSVPGRVLNKAQHTVEAWGQLKVVSGPHAGLIVPLSGRQVTIGRDEGDLQLPDDSMVSSQHAEIVATNDGRLLFVDKSRNGSIVDGNSVHRSQINLNVDSVLEVGGSRVEIHASHPPASGSAMSESPQAVVSATAGTAPTMMGETMPLEPLAAAVTGIFTGVELLVLSGADAHKRFLVQKDTTTIGRLEDQDVRLTDGFVSREHAILRRQGDDWVLSNVSEKGTTINGQPCLDTIIRHGDRIALGSTVIEFSLVAEAQQRSAKTILE